MNNGTESSKEANVLRQPWEPSGVINSSVTQKKQTYNNQKSYTNEGGVISLEVEDIFNNKGVMNNKG